MKVLIFGSTAHLTFNIARLAIALKRTGLEVAVISTKKEEQPGLIAELSANSIHWYEIKPVDKIFSLNLLKTLTKIIKILKVEELNIIHCNCFRHLILSWIACQFLQYDAKLFVTVHTILHGTRFENLILQIEKLILLWTNSKAITVSDDTRMKLIYAGTDPKKITTIPNGIDLDYLDRSVSIGCENIKQSSYSLNVVNVGALIPRKGHEYLIGAAKLCKEHGIPVVFRIVGEGKLRSKLMKMIKEYQLEDRVFLLGRITEYSELYRILSDVFIFPTKAELLPFTVLEAMAARKPVIATNVGGIKEIVSDHVNGILLPMANEKILSEQIFYSILELYKNKELILKLGEFARKTIEEKFSIQGVANRLKNEYEKALCK